MVSSLSSPLAVAGIIGIVIGLVLAISGLIALISNQSQPNIWYVWLLLVLGLVMGVGGGVMLALALNQSCAMAPNPMCVGPATQQTPVSVYQEPVSAQLQYPSIPTPTVAAVGYQTSKVQVGYQSPNVTQTLVPTVSQMPVLVNEGKTPISTTIQVSSAGAPSVSYE